MAQPMIRSVSGSITSGGGNISSSEAESGPIQFGRVFADRARYVAVSADLQN
jgi:hypothetical protein